MRFKKLEKYDYIKTKKEALEQLEYLRQEHNYMLERLDKWITKTEKAVDYLYCIGEAIDPEYQKELLKTLIGGNDENN